MDYFILSSVLGLGCLILLTYLVLTAGTKVSKIPEEPAQVEILNQNIGELRNKNHDLIARIEQQQLDVQQLTDRLRSELLQNKKILSQKKSSETRLGTITENLIPFLKDCPYAPGDMIFLGKPIDYLVVDYDQGELVFLEVKSGNSKESARQKTIKNIIKEGKVYYEQMRVNEKGVKTKRETNT